MIYVIGIEALIVALFAGVFSESFLIGIGAFVGTFLLYNIPILGQMFGVICSICEAYIAYKLVIMLNWIGTTGGMFFAIILFVVLYYLHNAFFYDIDEIPVEYIGWGWLLSEALLVGMFVEFLINSAFIGFVGIALTVALVIVSVIPYIRVVGMAFLSVFMGYTTYSVFIGTVEKKNAIIGGLIIFVFSVIMYVYVYKSLDYRGMVLRKKYSALEKDVQKDKITKVGVKFLPEENATNTTENYIQKLENLSSQASGGIKKEIERELRLSKKGSNGEETVKWRLKAGMSDMYIIHDINLRHGNLTAQIDFLVFTAKNIFILECKNLSGDLEVGYKGNFSRILWEGGRKKEKRIASPIEQNKIHLNILCSLYEDIVSNHNVDSEIRENIGNNIKEICKPLVVLANSKSNLNMIFATKEERDQITHDDHLVRDIQEIDANTERIIGLQTMHKIAQLFLEYASHDNISYEKKYRRLEEKVKKAQYFKGYSKRHGVDPSETKAEKLKKYRREQSKKEGMAPYYIFNNESMNDLLKKNPRTKEELLKVKGFGQTKTDKYGDDILKILEE